MQRDTYVQIQIELKNLSQNASSTESRNFKIINMMNLRQIRELTEY